MEQEKDRALVRLGENIRAFREERGISQEELAHQAGLDRTYIGGAERGERNLTVLSALKIANALSEELPNLFCGVK